MKRMMTIIFVLAIINITDAGMVDIVISSLNENPINPVKEITIKPTDIINFDIVYTQDFPQWHVWSLSLDMVVEGRDGGKGTLNISQYTRPTRYWNPDLSSITAKPYGALLDFIADDIDTVKPGIILDHFLLHCDAPGDVLIRLLENPNTIAGATRETDGLNLYPLSAGPGVIIHQIPEPSTLLMLGLGALFLRRKK